jgi:hypothetical protein
MTPRKLHFRDPRHGSVCSAKLATTRKIRIGEPQRRTLPTFKRPKRNLRFEGHTKRFHGIVGLKWEDMRHWRLFSRSFSSAVISE